MTPCSLRRWIWWLLPLWVARALLPVGFMLSGEAGGPQLVVCSGTGAVPAFHSPALQSSSLDAPENHPPSGYAGAQSAHHDDGAAHDNSPCPFALAGCACVASAPHVVAFASTTFFNASPFHLEPPRDERPARIDRIRGPPSLI
jgi:hypothetical protein